MAQIAEALSAAGLSVWWDTAILGGAAFAKDIARELNAADVVVVAWSATSVDSAWVLDEAGAGRDRNRLVPVQLDSTFPPLGFRQLQSIDLSTGKGRVGDAKLAALVSAIHKLAGAPVVAPVAKAPPLSSLNRRILIGSGAALGAAALAGGGWWLTKSGSAAAAETSIAVLPFANLSGDAAQAYFSDGLAEELRSALARIAGLTVAARTSSEKMRDVDVQDAAAKLGVAHMLTGSVRVGNGTIRVSTQLLDGKTGLETWSQAYDRPQGDALTIQTSIATDVANALSLSLGKAAAMLGGTKNPAAYDAYLRAQAIFPNGDPMLTREKLALFDVAIAADPEFAAAHAGRSMELSGLYNMYLRADDADAAEAAALRAIALAPQLPAAHYALASKRQSTLDFRGAAETYERILRLPGISSRELDGAARFKAVMGQPREALMLAERAAAVDPLNPRARLARVRVMLAARAGQSALTAIEVLEAVDPSNKVQAGYKGNAFLLLGRLKEAAVAYGEEPVAWISLTGQAIAYARLGDRANADKAFTALKYRRADVAAYQIAQVHAVRGETELALATLSHAVGLRDPGLANLRVDPEFDGLRKNPRFMVIEKSLNFPPL